MSRLRVELSPKALGELVAQFDWWKANRSARQAERWLTRALQQIEQLVHAPEAHPPSAEGQDLNLSIRDCLIGKPGHPTHRAVFMQKGDVVSVLTIRSLRQPPLGFDDL